jgi:hypothetical protein
LGIASEESCHQEQDEEDEDSTDHELEDIHVGEELLDTDENKKCKNSNGKRPDKAWDFEWPSLST